MNRRQKSIILNIIFIVTITTMFVVGMYIVKNYINRSESMRAMKQIGDKVLEHRRQYQSLPPESFIHRQTSELDLIRLGELQYRAPWIGIDSEPETILAYTTHSRKLLTHRGYVVLRLDGRVEWIEANEFRKLLGDQQKQAEVELLQRDDEF